MHSRISYLEVVRGGRFLAGLLILLATGVVPSGRGWVAGLPKGCFGHLSSTCNEHCKQ